MGSPLLVSCDVVSALCKYNILHTWPLILYAMTNWSYFFEQAARVLVQVLVMGSGIVGRAIFKAYQQALTNASKSGVAQETIQNTVRRGIRPMTEQEAREILGVTEGSSWQEIMQKYNTLFERNASGSFYLQSKIQKAKEYLEAVNVAKGQGSTV
ncbi:hypothetical protein IFM89_021562 [Coptis chinensis]|uniref:Uncharacterized protein n=1 Tax=Coptis chinensis TaxID=261450 RepID=A0A835M0E3_9MAGN|nr:hypothetical protein IFM89_021562 [Coptis chinensis]